MSKYNKRNNSGKKLRLAAIILIVIVAGLTGIIRDLSARDGGYRSYSHDSSYYSANNDDTGKDSNNSNNNLQTYDEPDVSLTADEIPAYDSKENDYSPSIELNDNIPYFSDSSWDYGYEYYSELDDLGRCGTCEALVGEETMPSEERGSIRDVHPSGWHNKFYKFMEGDSLYNRSHLLGFKLTAENANERNLITGTRYFNSVAMLPYEDQVAEYVYDTGGHVKYRVTPIFNGNELVTRGVVMEAYSIEDSGESVCYCVFCYNVQPGVDIDYATGYSSYDGDFLKAFYNSDSYEPGSYYDEDKAA